MIEEQRGFGGIRVNIRRWPNSIPRLHGTSPLPQLRSASPTLRNCEQRAQPFRLQAPDQLAPFPREAIFANRLNFSILPLTRPPRVE